MVSGDFLWPVGIDQIPMRVPKEPHNTGGFFSEGYHVQDLQGKKAFLKVIYLETMFEQRGTMEVIQEVLTTFRYEKELLEPRRSSDCSYVFLYSCLDLKVKIAQLNTVILNSSAKFYLFLHST